MDWKSFMADATAQRKNFYKADSDITKAWVGLAEAAKADGPLDHKTKEFIALATAIAVHCQPCIGFHIQALIKLGVTREEMSDALGMCVQMGGGPGVTYAAYALEAYDQLSAV